MVAVEIRRSARSWRAAAVGLALGALTGCTGAPPDPAATSSRSPAASPPVTSTPAGPAPTPSGAVSTSPPAGPSTDPPPVRFDVARTMADVRHLADRIGPRLATDASYRRAGRWVAARFRDLGYDVARPSFPVPAGDSWGVPVDAGRSFNVEAAPAGFDATRPHRVVGAHLDTVAVAPGAEDNASGVAVLLELARLAAADEPSLPTVFVAFGAEEPRGPGDDQHHFGSRRYVATMGAAERRALRAMASLDRVGVGTVVPVCTGPLSPDVVQRTVLRTARRLGVPTTRARTPPATTGRSRRPATRSCGSAAPAMRPTTRPATSPRSSPHASSAAPAGSPGRGSLRTGRPDRSSRRAGAAWAARRATGRSAA